MTCTYISIIIIIVLNVNSYSIPRTLITDININDSVTSERMYTCTYTQKQCMHVFGQGISTDVNQLNTKR